MQLLLVACALLVIICPFGSLHFCIWDILSARNTNFHCDKNFLFGIFDSLLSYAFDVAHFSLVWMEAATFFIFAIKRVSVHVVLLYSHVLTMSAMSTPKISHPCAVLAKRKSDTIF